MKKATSTINKIMSTLLLILHKVRYILSIIMHKVRSRLLINNNNNKNTVLDVTDISTIAQAKKSYMKQFYANQRNNEKLLELNDSFNLFKRTVNVKEYLLIQEWKNEIILDFFEKLENKYAISMPVKFADGDFIKFYRQWNVFMKKLLCVDSEMKGVKKDDMKKDDMKKDDMKGICEIIKKIERQDPRIHSNISSSRNHSNISSNNKRDTSHKNTNKNTATIKSIKKEPKFFCSSCKKGFNNENTWKDHTKSTKHRELAGEVNENVSLRDVKNPVKGCGDKDLCDDTCLDDNNDLCDDTRLDNQHVDNHKEDNNTTKMDHEIFRTCGICKAVFKSRGELVRHLGDSH